MDYFEINQSFFDEIKEMVDNDTIDGETMEDINGNVMMYMNMHYVEGNYHIFIEGLEVLDRIADYITENYDGEDEGVYDGAVELMVRLDTWESLHESTLAHIAVVNGAALVKTTLYAKRIMDMLKEKDSLSYDDILYTLDVAPERCEFAINVLYDADVIFCPETENEKTVYMLTEYGEMIYHSI